MSKRVSKAASQELAFLAALESLHADVDISKIAEIQDWSRAVRGKLYGASIKGTSHIPNPEASLPPAMVTNVPSPSRVALDASGNVAGYGRVQYSQIAIPQLIAVGISESSEEAWSEFVRRSQRLIKAVIAKAVRRSGNVSHDLVDDLTQNVYLKLCANNFRALRNVEILEENAFFSFLRVVATHTVEDHFRSTTALRMGTREPELLEADLVLPERAPSSVASSELERGILLEKIDTILKTLSHKPNFARDRAIFWLYYKQGLPATEIAALPDIKLSVKGVESVLLRLTRQLKVALR
jgi:RNA polymerase sigma-70 factor (ECF subfamily)